MKSQALLILLTASSALAQGTFQNLDFESTRNIPGFDPRGHPWSMPAGDALPGWSCYLDTNQVGSVFYNELALDSATVGIQSSTSTYVPAGFLGGEYCLSLQGGYVFKGPYVYYRGIPSVAQTGQLPADARSIQFKSSGFWVSVTFNGIDIPLAVLASQTNYNVLGGDISQFAGQTGELRFISHWADTFPPSYLDDIEFSASAIPEPRVLTLFALGTVLLTWRFLRQPRP